MSTSPTKFSAFEDLHARFDPNSQQSTHQQNTTYLPLPHTDSSLSSYEQSVFASSPPTHLNVSPVSLQPSLLTPVEIQNLVGPIPSGNPTQAAIAHAITEAQGKFEKILPQLTSDHPSLSLDDRGHTLIAAVASRNLPLLHQLLPLEISEFHRGLAAITAVAVNDPTILRLLLPDHVTLSELHYSIAVLMAAGYENPQALGFLLTHNLPIYSEHMDLIFKWAIESGRVSNVWQLTGRDRAASTGIIDAGLNFMFSLALCFFACIYNVLNRARQ